MDRFDVVVVGGGHAGCEAASAAARVGARTLLVTQSLATMGEMSCNPAIGGIGKGHLVREIDALGGLMGRAADAAGIHFKVLNRSKGPAVRGPRAQADRDLYRAAIQGLLARQPGLSLLAGEVVDLTVDPAGRLSGLALGDGRAIGCGAAVLTTGTFLRGVTFVGHQQKAAGRHGEAPSVAIAHRLLAHGLPLGRLKTGTPPRLARDSIDWTGLDADWGDAEPEPFSFWTDRITNPQIECRITHTTPATHTIIRDHLHLSAMYGGLISGKGPRYCPSIEDKVTRFADRERHQVFLEPEGLGSELVYPNGISTSLPSDIQAAMIHSMPGLDQARIVRPGYAIEYDYVDPRSLTHGLELRAIEGLFLAGQINGTTGYEEAAAQGVMAGINATRRASGLDGAVLDRAAAYIGVLIDDLVTQGVTEPYRMFTSRAEYRLSLRPDNAPQRLGAFGRDIGVLRGPLAGDLQAFELACASAVGRARATPMSRATKAALGLSGGEVRTVFDAVGVWDGSAPPSEETAWVEALPVKVRGYLITEALYAPYLSRQEAAIRRYRRMDAVPLSGLDFDELPGLSAEIRSKLVGAQPRSLEAASRIEGMTPSALTLLAAAANRGAGVSRGTAGD